MNNKQKITTFFMFEGNAEEAMEFYISLFEDSSIDSITRYENGTVMHATFSIKGQSYMAIDSPISHEFAFTPSVSLFVDCDTSHEVEWLFKELSQDGQVLMPLSPSPISEKFGWIQDRFGVSWQLNLLKSN